MKLIRIVVLLFSGLVLMTIGNVWYNSQVQSIFPSLDYQIENPNIPESCMIARRTTLQTLSYSPNLSPITVPNNHFRHVSDTICKRSLRERLDAEVDNEVSVETFPKGIMPTIETEEMVKKIFVFKFARVGSTFLTDVLMRLVRQTGRPTLKFWEPYGSANCTSEHQGLVRQEGGLQAILSRNCRWHWTKKCTPAQRCSKKGFPYGIYLTAANPRFFNAALDWKKIFSTSKPSTIRLFSLRRTNLVLIGYSKFHHGGCAIDTNDQLSWFTSTTNNIDDGQFSLDMLLQCVEHYALADQEISTSIAFHAGAAIGVDPFVVVYEDVMKSPDIVQEGLISYLKPLSSSPRLAGKFFNPEQGIFDKGSTKVQKVHTKPFCENEDVDCPVLLNGLKNDYPCLYKQLLYESKGYVWTVPMKDDGTISMNGNCKTIDHLSENKNTTRQLSDLYQLPS